MLLIFQSISHYIIPAAVKRIWYNNIYSHHKTFIFKDQEQCGIYIYTAVFTEARWLKVDEWNLYMCLKKLRLCSNNYNRSCRACSSPLFIAAPTVRVCRSSGWKSAPGVSPRPGTRWPGGVSGGGAFPQIGTTRWRPHSSGHTFLPTCPLLPVYICTRIQQQHDVKWRW